MLADALANRPVPRAIDDSDGEAILGGSENAGEVTLVIAPERLRAVCLFLKQNYRFSRLSNVTAVDRYPAGPRFEVVYHLHSIERNERLRLKCRLEAGSPEIDSVTAVWRSANWYEREVFDLFGIRFNGHPNLKRLLLPDDWDGHPLRKDYPVHGYKYSYQDE